MFKLKYTTMHHYSVINTLCVIWTCIYLTQAQEPKQISPSALKEEMYSQCGGVLKEPRGVLSTPNFPNPYPVPIRCRWIIEAPADRVIALYFSQFYMREGVTVIEYAFYSDTLHMGEKELGSVSSDHQPTFLVSNKPVLVLDFLVRESSNVHLRVREYLLDVFGFNITYEIVGRNESARKDACIYDHCSYSGSCFASVEFAGYACHCFGGHYGEECQYSPGCEPGSESTCLNGGTCRYLIGSTIKGCECPSGYEGSHCEKRKEDKRLMAQCLALGCSQTCGLTNHGDYKCTCLAGYHLSEDKKTCVEKGRTRYLVSFKLYDQNVDLAHLDTTRYTQLKKGIESALLQLFQPKLYKVENMTVLNFQPGAVVQFHFFGEQEDSATARSILEEALRSRNIGKYAVDRSYVGFEAEPALSIQSVESSVKMPVVGGSELSLACLTRGSSAMRVSWLKDGHPIDPQGTPHIWTTLVPKNSRDQYTAILGFDKAHVLDSGEFTCQVTDWGSVHTRTLRVSVVSFPRPKVVPITATVAVGERLVVTCFSDDEGTTSLGYNWLKNGRILNPSVEPEVVEDLFPGGSRLLIQTARASATYTCIVNSVAGGSRKDATVTVIAAGGSTPICQAEKYLEVQWSNAAVNTEDIQFCPKGYTGEVRRHCTLQNDNGAAWIEPDYSGCLSSEFLAIKDKFESLRLGYLLTDVGAVLVELRTYVWRIGARFHVAEGEPVVDLLEGMHDYLKGNMEHIANNSQVFLDIVSFLLDSPRLIKKQSHVLKLHQQILSHGLMQGAVVGGDTFHMFHRSALALEVGQLRNEGQRVLRFPSRKSTREVKGSTQPAWLTDSVELDFNTWVFENLQEVNDSISIAVVFYKNFTAFLPERFLTHYGYGSGSLLHRGLDMEYQLHSRIVAVAVQTGQRNVGGSKSPTKLKVKARLAHLDHMVNRQIMWNISCGVADFSQGNVQFSIEGCQTLQTGNYSLCQCNHVGTYAVLLTTYAQPDEFLFRDGFEVIAGVGCAICAFFVFLTFFILLVLWRKIRGAITALKLQVCFALIGAYATILKALHESLNKDWYPWCVVSIQFFLLAAFSLQLCLALTVYLECASAHARGLRNPELKLAALGWAFPMIVVGATLAAQLPDGFRLNSWWIQLQTNYFYAFSIAVIIIIVLHIMLVMTVKSELNFDNKHGTSKRSKSFNRSCLLNRSLVIILFLLSVSVSSIMYVNFDDELYKYAFSSSSGMLGFMVFLCYTVCSENAHSLCFSAHTIEEEDDENKELGTKSRPGAYQNFLKPEIMSDTFYSGKMPDAVEVNGRVEKLRKQHFPMCPEEIEWKEVDRFLVEKSSIVHDFTVHHQRSPLVVAKANEAPQVENSDYRDEGDEEEVISPLHLQQMDDSPRNSQLLHFKEPDGQEDAKQFYELGVAHPHNTPPDILEPTKQAFFNTPSHQMKVLAHPCLTTFVGEQCVITTGDLDMGQAPSTGSYSTFRPPAKPEDDKIFLQSHSKSPALPRHQDKPLRVPDIGDEPLIPAKKKDGPLQVAAPVVPDKDDQKKGWSITTV